jgi:ubiquinone/menaquinone biosynthesis C-methylase UbiE
MARTMWASGDYASWGDLFAGVGGQLVEELGVHDLDVLDVATGTGNTAIAAARAGGRVTGLDITPKLLAIAAERADAATLDIRWIESDMTTMPVPEQSFDRVLSTFGVMLAPDRPAMAAELLRVCRPGGVVAITNWSADAGMSKLGAIVGGFFPPPEQAPPDPTDWAVPELVTTYFADLPATITTASRTIGVRWPSADAAAEMIEKGCGPLTGAVAALRENGDWPKARAAIVEMLEAEAGPEPGGLTVDMPYLLTVARRDE